MKASKKLLSLLLVVMLLVSAIPFQALAAPVGVPVRIEKEDGAFVGNDTLTVPDDGVTLSKELGDGLLGESAAYETLYWKSAVTGNQLPLTETLTNATASAQDYSIKLVVRDKAPTPTTYTATLQGTLDGAPVGSVVSKNNISTINLNEALAREVYDFDAAAVSFVGWKEGSGEKNLTANAVFNAEFKSKFTITYKVTLDGVERSATTETKLKGDTLTLDTAAATAKFGTGYDADKYVFAGWKKSDGTAAEAAPIVSANATYTAVFTTKPAEAPTYKATIYVTLDGVAKNPVFETNVSTLNRQSVYEQVVNAKSLGQVDDFTYYFYRGTTVSEANRLTADAPLTQDSTFTLVISTKPATTYHNIKVYAVKYVGNVNKGVVSDPIFDSGNIEGTVKLLDYLNSKYTEIEANAESIATDAQLGTNPTFYNNRELTSKVVNTTLTDASKVVYVRVNVPEVKNVLLYVHKGTELSKLTHLDPKVLHGYVEGSYVTYDQVQAVLGKNVKFYGLFTEERWDNRNASIKDDALPQIQVPAGGVEIHVWVTSGNVFNADPTNPKTGDYILDTAVTLMVISGLAAAAVYVIGKKRRV